MTDLPPTSASSGASSRSIKSDSIDSTLEESLITPNSCYQRRIKRTVKIFQVIFALAGFVLLVVQIVQGIMALNSGRGISFNIAIGCCVAIALMLIARPPVLNNAIARFAHRSRYRSFQRYVFILPFFMAALVIWAKLKIGPTSDEWRYVSSEGSLSEYGTAIVYLLIPAFAYPMMRQFRKEQKRFLSLYYGLFAFAAFFVGMEEISWGQRLIGFEEPEFISKHNVQSEFTLHNLSFYQNHLLHDSFLLAGFIGSFCWIALRYWQRKQKRKVDHSQPETSGIKIAADRSINSNIDPNIDPSYVLPDWFLSSYFYPIFIFYLALDYTDLRSRFDFLHHADQEHWEFVMSLGVLLFVMIKFFEQGKAVDSAARESVVKTKF